MWSFEPSEGAWSLVAGGLYLGAVLAFLSVQQAGLRLRHEEARAWWAGSGRDLINTAGLLAISGALRLVGFPWAGALFVGGTLTLLMFGASVFVGTQTDARHPRLWAFAAGLALSVPVLLVPRVVLGAFARVAATLFGAGR